MNSIENFEVEKVEKKETEDVNTVINKMKKKYNLDTKLSESFAVNCSNY